ncbi:XrtA/PEP-CTERM system-associated ATPase [Azospirillum canadense]|uniref:XrtA/PEP-CTERM system-associated ATPase n=1 Tax=Azospirillum canadense TaxID=403962 RepID=UPI002226CECD|nr:XrtA/PEP-CTERM system-associated ATPase [Azospirillum canadense]MCW2240896.1 putative secretion ATPase (PEP-CTERM system associated) [Azospirillum canadense]
MYEDFYGLKGNAFRLSPDHRFFFKSRSHNKAIAYLNFGLEQGEGFIVITGPVGAGKSTLMGQLASQLDTSRFVAAQIVTTQIDADDAIRLILAAFRIQPAGSDKASAIGALQDFLRQQHRAQRRVLMMVDEAQNLPLRTLEELRMLSNFTVGGQALFQCFLLGQPQFVDIMNAPELEQLRQRVIASYHLEPMSAAETRQYIEHRLALVGWRNDPAIADEAYPLIHQETGGVPRLINLLCNRLLLFGALEGLHELDAQAVQQVIEDMRGELTGPPRNEALAAPQAAPSVTAPTGHGVAPDAARLTLLEKRVVQQERVLRSLLEATLGVLPSVPPVPADAPETVPDREVVHD